MPYESTFDVKFYVNGKEVDSLMDIPFIRDYSGNEENPMKILAERIYDRYKTFNEAGFDEKQAFALTRDWFNHELENYYGKED